MFQDTFFTRNSDPIITNNKAYDSGKRKGMEIVSTLVMSFFKNEFMREEKLLKNYKKLKFDNIHHANLILMNSNSSISR